MTEYIVVVVTITSGGFAPMIFTMLAESAEQAQNLIERYCVEHSIVVALPSAIVVFSLDKVEKEFEENWVDHDKATKSK